MIRILIVDDHPVIRSGLRKILTDACGLRKFQEAKDADEAIDTLAVSNCDLVISDISMPGKSGVELLRYVKQVYPALPVLLLSIHPEERYAAQARQLGASGYVQKDVVASELSVAVGAVLKGHQHWSVRLKQTIADNAPVVDGTLHYALTGREFEVFYKLGRGESVTQIADELCLSVQTVSTYRARILIKLNMSNNADIMHYVMRNGLTRNVGVGARSESIRK